MALLVKMLHAKNLFWHKKASWLIVFTVLYEKLMLKGIV